MASRMISSSGRSSSACPPKALLRCRAVCHAWRLATSMRDFLLAHHGHQPTLLLLEGYNCVGVGDGVAESVDIITFDHREGIAADKLQSVARLENCHFMDASCDGLIFLSQSQLGYSICNPTTIQYAPLPMLSDFRLLGMYRHRPTGEYRVLMYEYQKIDGHIACYIFTLGSVQQPRNIGCLLKTQRVIYGGVAVLFRGNLHWYTEQHESGCKVMIVVFDTIAESFRQMHGPVAPDPNLFEMDGMLGMSSLDDEGTNVDIWVLQDYEGEGWAFKCRVELPVVEIRQHCESFQDTEYVMVVPAAGKLLVLVQCDDWLFQVDVNGKLVATFHRKGLFSTRLRLKQTLVPHTFFPTLEGYVTNAWPFI